MLFSSYNMKKVRKTLRNLLYAGAITLAGFLNMNKVEGQKYTFNPFVSTNANGAEYDLLKTRTQRDSLTQEKLNEDWVSEINSSINPIWDCTEYSRQLMINFHGFPELEGYPGENLDSIYYYGKTLKDNGKYGLPVYFVDIWYDENPSEGHNMNCILTGNNGEKFEDWNFIEPQNDKINIKPGAWDMPMNCEIEVNAPPKDNNGNYLSRIPILKFQITNGNANLIWKNTSSSLKLITNRDSVNSNLENKINYSEIKFYPNPVKNAGIFEFENNENKEVYLEIYDVSGRAIGKKSSNSKKIEFDFSDLSCGIYFYKLKNPGNLISTGKLIKD